jgi:hypothetical protein
MNQSFPCKLFAAEATTENAEGRDIATRIRAIQEITLSDRGTKYGQGQ